MAVKKLARSLPAVPITAATTAAAATITTAAAATAAITAAAAGRPFLTRARLVYRQGAALKFLAVKLRDRRVGLGL